MNKNNTTFINITEKCCFCFKYYKNNEKNFEIVFFYIYRYRCY